MTDNDEKLVARFLAQGGVPLPHDAAFTRRVMSRLPQAARRERRMIAWLQVACMAAAIALFVLCDGVGEIAQASACVTETLTHTVQRAQTLLTTARPDWTTLALLLFATLLLITPSAKYSGT